MRDSQFSSEAACYFKVPDFELHTLLPHNHPHPIFQNPFSSGSPVTHFLVTRNTALSIQFSWECYVRGDLWDIVSFISRATAECACAVASPNLQL